MLALVAGVGVAGVATRPAAGQAHAANVSGIWDLHWDSDGSMRIVEDDGIYCGTYFVSSDSYGWISGTLAGTTLTGAWDGVTDGGGGLVLNFAGTNVTGTSGDSAHETTGHTITGRRQAAGRAGFNFAHRWTGHWNGEATTLTLTQHGNAVTGTIAAASWAGTVEGHTMLDVLNAHYTDTTNHTSGRMVMHTNNNNALVGAASSDRTTCFGSWDIDFHL